MNPGASTIVFIDNAVNGMFRTIEALRGSSHNIQIFISDTGLEEFLRSSPADIIFIKLDMQPNDGLVILREIQQHKLVPQPFLVIYTEKQDDFVQELAFNSGVDAFINFHNKSAVMALFVRNLLRRRKFIPAVNKKEVIIDSDKYLIYKNNVPYQLPRKEFRLFELLSGFPEKFFTKTEIAQIIWHDESVAKKRTIDVHIYNIRQLFGKRIIQSQKGKGYRINKKITG